MISLPLRLALLLTFGAWLTPTLHAELAWAQKTVELKADAKTPVIEARYHFTNQGSAPVDIGRVESSCGCTTATLDKRRYEPGQGGDIVARFTVGNRVGPQRKTILVEANDGRPPTELVLMVNIPEILRIDPPFVRWEHGEAAAPKFITLEMLQDTPVREITVQSSNSGVAVAVEPLVKGRKYRLAVTPGQTRENLFAALMVRCKFGDEDKEFRAYATVKPPPKD